MFILIIKLDRMIYIIRATIVEWEKQFMVEFSGFLLQHNLQTMEYFLFLKLKLLE